MSCNGCRILRKGCSDFCVLRSSIQWIDGADAQSHATVFVAKFFGRAGLLSFLSSVPEPNRPALFRSLLYEACGRTVNPVTGAVGLQWTGNWDACEAAVEIVLRGGIPPPIPELGGGSGLEELYGSKSYLSAKRRNGFDGERSPPCDLDLCLTPRSPVELKLRAATPSMNLDESVMTSEESGGDRMELGERRLLNLFV